MADEQVRGLTERLVDKFGKSVRFRRWNTQFMRSDTFFKVKSKKEKLSREKVEENLVFLEREATRKGFVQENENAKVKESLGDSVVPETNLIILMFLEMDLRFGTFNWRPERIFEMADFGRNEWVGVFRDNSLGSVLVKNFSTESFTRSRDVILYRNKIPREIQTIDWHYRSISSSQSWVTRHLTRNHLWLPPSRILPPHSYSRWRSILFRTSRNFSDFGLISLSNFP